MEQSESEMTYDTSILKDVIVSRSEPEIYAFRLNGVENALKIGSTYIGVERRIDQWKAIYGEDNVEHLPSWRWSARVKNKDVYFKDHAVHTYLENHNASRLTRNQFSNDILLRHYSNEFYRLNNSSEDGLLNLVNDAVADINQNYGVSDEYTYYQTDDLPVYETFERVGGTLNLRSNQEPVVDAFYDAVINKHRTNLLMYAVMRFGKTFTALSCAQKIDANLVVIVSAKANVEIEWRKMCQYYDNFKDYTYYNDEMLKNDNKEKELQRHISRHEKVILFLSLETLNTPKNVIKTRHSSLFKNKIDLLIIDETHFGARGDRLGQFVGENEDSMDEDVALNVLEENTVKKKVLPAKIKLHLSGTPYRVMLSSEFQDDDIICFCQYNDILSAKEEWVEENNEKPENEREQEWKNDYFGFPKMIRFAYNLSDSFLSQLNAEFDSDADSNISRLFSVNDNGQFIYEEAVLDLFKKIDGEDKALGFLNYPEIKEVELCRHIVCVMPSCASCDALENLFNQHKNEFHNLEDYELLNISPSEGIHRDSDSEVMSKIANFADQGVKTITLTVNRMLTGSTVPQWDTMLYFKPGTSPQEYDQATFRLQNPYIKKVTYDDDEIEVDLKPQTLLVDFIPNRMFVIEEQKCQILSSRGEDNGGNRDLEKYMSEKDLPGLPIYLICPNELKEITAHDITNDIRNYDKNTGIAEELKKIPKDVRVAESDIVKRALIEVYPFAKKGHLVSPSTDDEPDEPNPDAVKEFTPTNPNPEDPQQSPENDSVNQSNNQTIDWKACIDTYNTMILLYAFLTDTDVRSLDDIVDSFSIGRNEEIFKHVGLDKNVLESMLSWYKANNTFVLTMLDYSIQDMNELSKTDSTDGREPEEKVRIAIQKFGKLGENVVLTPDWVCKKMVDEIPITAFSSLDENHKILEISSTSGEFAVALYHKMKELNIGDDIIKNSIYVIPKNVLCYELIRKIYTILGLNANNIASFTSMSFFQKVDKQNNNGEIKTAYVSKLKFHISYISGLLKQNKQFNEIKIESDIMIDKEENNQMKFNAIVGNPPYQLEVGKTEKQNQGNTNFIYYYFQNIADKLGRYTSLIYPFGGWFDNPTSFNNFGYNLLNDSHTLSISAYEGTADKRAWFRTEKLPDPIFSNDANLSAGVCIVVRDLSKIVSTLKYSNRVYCDDVVEISQEDIDYVCPNPLFVSINKKIGKPKLKEQIKKGIFNIESNFVELNPTKVSFDKNDWDKPILLYTNDKGGSAGRCTKFWTDKDNIPSGSEYFDYYKVIMTSAYPKKTIITGGATTSNIQSRLHSLIEVLPPNSAFGASRMTLFMSKDENEIDNFIKYTQTKFFAGLVLQEPNRRSTIGSIIPSLDYSNHSDIDWSKSIDDINAQLYAKYHLTNEEIEFIEKDS